MIKIALITLDLTILNSLWISKLNFRQQKHQASKLSKFQQQVQHLQQQLSSLTNNNGVRYNTISINLKTTLTSINITLEGTANDTISNTIIAPREKKFSMNVNDDMNVSTCQLTNIEMSQPNTNATNTSISSKKHAELFDFSKLLNVSRSFAEYTSASQDSINKNKDCFELFNFLIGPSKIIEMLVFKDAYDIGLQDFNNLSKSTFIRANRLYSVLFEQLTNLNFLSKILESQILSYNVGMFNHVLEECYSNHN